MTFLAIALALLLCASLTVNFVFVRMAVRLDNALLEGGEAVEDALDDINSAYGTVGKILQSPLAANDPKIVQIHKELKRVHERLLVVADRLVSSWNQEEQDSTGEQS